MNTKAKKRTRRTAYTWERNWEAIDKLTKLIDGNPSATRVLEMVIEAGICTMREKYKKGGKKALPSKPEEKSRHLWTDEEKEVFGE